MINLIIPGELPDLNTIIAAAKDHFGQYSTIKLDSTNIVSYLAIKLPKGLPRVHVVCHWYCKDRRKDPDGVSGGVKFILDGLVKAGVLENDGWKQIAGIEHRFSVDKQAPRVEVALYVADKKAKEAG